MGKLHYLTALLLIILLAIVSGWVLNRLKKTHFTKKKLRHDPDYFFKNFTATTIDNNGKPAYKVKARHLEHYPDDNSMKLQYPLFSFYENNIKIWTAQANEALIIENNETIYLTGQVILNQISLDNDAPMILTADQLTLEPEKKRAHTKTKVNFQKGQDVIFSIGMNADLHKNKVEFLSKTRSRYVLPAQ